MFNRLGILKTVLWLFVGVWATATVARFVNGLGAATALNDGTPWGLWIGFDVMAGVALAAGGFVIAATVYIFGLEKYRVFARPAILTAFLGYVAVAVGLMYDLGLPWNIWHPMVYWQHHSVLFEVAMCVMLYLTVLALEFCPVVLEHPFFGHPLYKTIHRILKKATIPLVIAGIILSTLHQSSLGSLFLIVPFRLHPLWYSNYIYVFFFVSAIGLGLMMVMLESLLGGWFFKHKVRTDLLGGLGLAASGALGSYVLIRLIDLGAQGKLGLIFDGSGHSFLFLFELGVSAVIPAALLLIPKVRNSVAGLAVCAAMTVFGMILYRLDVCVIAFARPEGVSYFPAWTEIAVTLGVVSCATLIFIFFIENLKVYGDGADAIETSRDTPRPSFDPATLHYLSPYSLAGPRRYSLAFVAGAALAVGFLPNDAIFGSQPERAPVFAARTIKGYMIPRSDGFGHEFGLQTEVGSRSFDLEALDRPNGAQPVPFLKIDGNRDGRFVLFPHDSHAGFLEGQIACAMCHHMNMPFDENTSCHECHRDMFGETDIFNHASHAGKLGGGDNCRRCHTDRKAVKKRETATACIECHAGMRAEGSPVEGRSAELAAGLQIEREVEPSEKGLIGYAPGYKRIMHDEFAETGLCISCHRRTAESQGRTPGGSDHALTRCDACHRDIGASDLRQMPPYTALAKTSE